MSLPGKHNLTAGDLKELLSEIVVDAHDAAMQEAGDLLIPMSQGLITEDSIHAALGEIIVGRRPGRANSKEITLFKSVGIAIQDVAAAALVYARAQALGLGRYIKF